jgi:regulatory protein
VAISTGSSEPPLSAEDRLQRALELAYRHIDRRERTVSEVRLHLERRGIEERAVEQTLEILREQGTLDDARFARVFAEDKRALEGWGSERIRTQLLARGIDPELVDEAVGGDARGEELQRALGLLRRRFPSLDGDRRERERALGVLLRKGYDAELALDALRVHAAGDDGA